MAIVIPNWNGSAHLPDCLDAVRSLNYSVDALEVIVVDNGSSDDSRVIVRQSYPGVRLVQLDHNQGFAAACNAGAQIASAECLAFMNNDMRAERNWLRALVEAYEPSEGYVCVGGVITNWAGNEIDFVEGTANFHGFAWQEFFRRPLDDLLINDGADLLFACGGSMLVSRDVYLDLGGFDASYFAYYEDVDFGWRLWLSGHKVRLAGNARVRHRHHGSAAGLPKHLPRYLFERNALMTLVKNLSDENLARLLAPALLMLVYRAVALSRSPFDAFDSSAPTMFEVKRAGLVPLHAVVDLIHDLPNVLERRGNAQSCRQRRDEEIFELFGRPFRPWLDDERYLQASILLRELFGLDRLFVRQRTTQVLVVADEDAETQAYLAKRAGAADSVTFWHGREGDDLEALIAESDLVIAPAATRHADAITAETKGLLVVNVGDTSPPRDSPLLARADIVLGSAPEATPIEVLPAIVREPWRWRHGIGDAKNITVPEDLQRFLRVTRERKRRQEDRAEQAHVPPPGNIPRRLRQALYRRFNVRSSRSRF